MGNCCPWLGPFGRLSALEARVACLEARVAFEEAELKEVEQMFEKDIASLHRLHLHLSGELHALRVEIRRPVVRV